MDSQKKNVAMADCLAVYLQWYFTTFCGMPAETYDSTFGGLDGNDGTLGTVFDISPYLNGTVKPYDVCCFMINLPKSGTNFDFRSARVTVKGNHGSMSHHFFLSKELMPKQKTVVEALREVYTETSGLHFAELGRKARRLSLQGTCSLTAGMHCIDAALKLKRTTAGHDLKVLNHEVRRMLNSEWPHHKNTSLLDTWRLRDRLMRQIG